MRSNNPVFNNSGAFTGRGGYASFDTTTMSDRQLQEMYDRPPATALQTGRMTYEDVIMKTGAVFGVLLLAAGASWFLVETAPFVPFVAMIVGLVLGLVISFRQSTNPGLILTYAAVEGLFVGGISRFFNAQWDGIVAQAVIGTLAAFAAMLVLYRTGKIRATPKFTRTLMIAGFGYLLFCIVNLVVAMFTGGFGLRTGLFGLLIGAVGVTLASLFLVLDFDFVEQGVRQGAPARMAWLAAFGLLVTLVWLYVEFLRLLSILRGSE